MMDSLPVARYFPAVMNAPPKQDKFRAYRARKKAAGLREVRLWVPDLRRPEVRAELQRQAALLDRSPDERDAVDLMTGLADESWGDLD